MDRASQQSKPSSGTRLSLILSKRPRAGEVKTRLCPPLEPDQAARLAEGMLADAVERCSASPDFRTRLVFAPASEEAWFRSRFPALSDLRAQSGEGLAERLATAFEEAFEDGVGTVVAIGSDQPWVDSRRLGEAHEALEAGADLVLGPDLGGGYYLIGTKRSIPELFTGVTMSSSGMCAATMALAERLGLRVERLPEGYDVDVEADLSRLREDLRRFPSEQSEYPRHTAAALNEIDSPSVS